MFWKNKKKNESPEIEAPLFDYDSDCRRQNVRVRPISGLPVQAWLGGEEVDVLDISAGGMAVACTNRRPGDLVDFKARLGEEMAPVEGRYEVLNLDEQGGCRGRFVGLSPKTAELIHQYALKVQKEELRRQPQNPPQSGPDSS